MDKTPHSRCCQVVVPRSKIGVFPHVASTHGARLLSKVSALEGQGPKPGVRALHVTCRWYRAHGFSMSVLGSGEAGPFKIYRQIPPELRTLRIFYVDLDMTNCPGTRIRGSGCCKPPRGTLHSSRKRWRRSLAKRSCWSGCAKENNEKEPWWAEENHLLVMFIICKPNG